MEGSVSQLFVAITNEFGTEKEVRDLGFWYYKPTKDSYNTYRLTLDNKEVGPVTGRTECQMFLNKVK